jgi:hypothetical protein
MAVRLFTLSSPCDGFLKGEIARDLEYERALNQIHLARQVPREIEEDAALALYEGVIQCELGKQRRWP